MSTTGRSAFSQVGVPVLAGLLLFLVNNLLLARVLTRLPGGTALAVTDLAAAALIVSPRRFASITLIYATYAALAVLGHLGVDPVAELWRVQRLVFAAFVFDLVVALGRYRWTALVIGLLPFAAIISFTQRVPPSGPRFVAALALAYAGLALGLLLRRALERQAFPYRACVQSVHPTFLPGSEGIGAGKDSR
jgi:hypothetical protein